MCVYNFTLRHGAVVSSQLSPEQAELRQREAPRKRATAWGRDVPRTGRITRILAQTKTSSGSTGVLRTHSTLEVGTLRSRYAEK